MKIAELRQIIGKAEREQLEKAFAECYKKLPKAKKEELDDILPLILLGKDVKPAAKKSVAAMDFGVLKNQIEMFLENAYAQNYFAPNRTIPKSERSKWRFRVKNFIKELQNIPVCSENFGESARLLKELYCLICTACNIYLFSTEDPFRSIGMEQYDFFHMVVEKYLGMGYSQEMLSELVLLASSGGLDRESLHCFQQRVLLSDLKTVDMKYAAIQEVEKLMENLPEKLKNLWMEHQSQYDVSEAVNALCDLILMIDIELNEVENHIDYYFRTSQEWEQEIILYRALRIANWMGTDDDWLWIYEFGCRKKIQPRKELVEEYKKRKTAVH